MTTDVKEFEIHPTHDTFEPPCPHKVTTPMLRSRKKETLAWVNTERAKFGLLPLDELPKGVREDGNSCSIANAFDADAEVDAESLEITSLPDSVLPDLNGDIDIYYRRELPAKVADFVQWFDCGHYPSLIL